MKNENGNYVPVTQRAQTIANYLESKHWSNNLDAGMSHEPGIVHRNGADERLFTIEELSWSLKNLPKTISNLVQTICRWNY